MSFRKDGSVSIWLWRNKPEDEDYDPLKSDFGIDYYDIDELEPVGSNDASLQPVSELIGQLSYSESFGEAALSAAGRLEITESRLAIALFNFAYDPAKAGVPPPDDPQFLGVFEWDDADDV